MCGFVAHYSANFADESHIGFPRNLKIQSGMSFIIVIICVLGWLVPALKNGADVK